MQFRQQIRQKQTLKQRLNPKLIQRYKVFHSSYDQVVEQVQHEQEDNMFIEITQHDQLGSRSSSKSTGSDTDADFTDFASETPFQNLQDFLLNQINFVPLSTKKKQVLEKLIDGLNDNGFFINFSSTKQAIMTSLQVSTTTINDCLKQLQQFEPEGVGARSLAECLLIQVDHYELENDDLIKPIKHIISHHLTDIANQQYSSIAEACSMNIDAVEAIAQFIKENLNPNPGAQFKSIENHIYIVPSFDIKINDQVLDIQNLEQDKGIQFKLSAHYLNLLNDPSTDKKTKTYLQEKHAKAKELYDNLKQRRHILETLVSHIAKKQRLYFEKGNSFLVPLLQKEVAAALDLNPSNVSRILCSKFIHTPFGTIPLKHLCPRNYYGKTKENFQSFLKYYLEQYPKYSDQKISALLLEQGIRIARRTVAKYRHELQLDSSYFQGRQTNKDLITPNPEA